MRGVPASEPATYFEAFDALTGVSLEDSWVLDVRASDGDCVFRLDLVLTPEHAAYHSPKPGEQHCYVPATLRIAASDAMSFQRGQGQPARDATGESDYGHIDTFVPVDWEGRDAWMLTGDWGELLVAAPEVTVALSP
jgi:hypothetical protein